MNISELAKQVKPYVQRWIDGAILGGDRDLGTVGNPYSTVYADTVTAGTIVGTMTGSEWETTGNATIDANQASATTVVYVVNQASGGTANLDVEGSIVVGGNVDGVDVSAHAASTAEHGATGAVVGTTNTQTLTNKTLTTPTIGSFVNATHSHAAAASGGTVAHSATTGQTANDHHNQSHLFMDASGLGPDHTVSGLTASTFLRASSATTLAFGGISHSELQAVTANQHHNQAHVLATNTALGADHTISGATEGHVLRASSATAAAFAQLALSDLSGAAIGTNLQAWDANLDQIAALAVTDSNIIVGNGSAWVAESGATARTSLGVGTGDSPQFTAVELGHATDTTIARVSAGLISVEGDTVTLNTATQTLTNKTLTTPTIGSFTNATHTHQNAAGGGTLDHGLALTGLTDDDHTQYLLATGARTGASSSSQTFTTGVIDSSLTASRLMASDGSKKLASVATLSSWIAGTSNQLTVTDDGDGSATLSLPQNIHTAATPTFSRLTLSQTTGTAPMTISSTTKVANLNADLLDDLSTSSNPGAAAAVLTSDASGFLTLVKLSTDTLADKSGGNLTISPAGDVVFDPTGNDILPSTNYDLNIGAINKKYLTLHAAELWVETLVAQETIATIGGRVLVGPTTVLTRDLGTGDTTIYVKHNEMASGDRAYMEANGKVEFFAITSAPTEITPSVEYSYTVTRDLDGTGANQWYAGDAMFNTGTTGDGFIDLYSLRSVKSATQYGPSIVGNVRNSSTFNDWTEHWAIGNLNGVYGYGATTYGFAAGKYASGQPWIGVDATNGFRIMRHTTQLGQWDTSGNILVGEVGASKSNVYITSGAVKLRNNTTDVITLLATANANGQIATFDGAIGISTSGGIYQGTGTFASPTTGLKIWNDSGVGRIAGYNSGTAQWYANTDGKLYAGAGAVTLDDNGITITQGTAISNSLSWVSGSSVGAKVYTSVVGANNLISLSAEQIGVSDYLQSSMGTRLLTSVSPSYVTATWDGATDSSVEVYANNSAGDLKAYLYVRYIGGSAQIIGYADIIGLTGDVSVTGTVTLSNTGLHLLDTDASHDLIIAPGSNLTADRTLTLTTGDAARTITLSGNPTLADWFDQNVKTTGTPTFAQATVDNLRLDGNVLSSTSGAVTVTPLAGQNLNVSLSGAGDFAVNTDDLYVDTSTGNVGIGTTGPSNPLHIFDSALELIKAERTGGTADGSVTLARASNFISSGLNVGRIGSSDNLGLQAATSNQIIFGIGTSEAMRIDSNGNVGIGTTAPGSALEVNGDIEITAGQAIKPTANSTTALKLANAAGTAVVTVDTTNSRVGINGTPGAYALDVTGTLRTTGEALFNTTVGIAGSSGGYPLKVNGYTYITGLTGIGVAPTNPSYILEVTGEAKFNSKVWLGDELDVYSNISVYGYVTRQRTWNQSIAGSGSWSTGVTVASTEYYHVDVVIMSTSSGTITNLATWMLTRTGSASQVSLIGGTNTDHSVTLSSNVITINNLNASTRYASVSLLRTM